KDLLATGAIRAGVPFANAGAVAYEALWLLVPSLLDQGHSVVIDSACFGPAIEERGRAMAAAARAAYAMVECRCPPLLVEQRLCTRARLESQPTTRGAGAGRPGMYEPSCERVIVDTSQTLDDAVLEALAELGLAPSPPGPLSRLRGRGGAR